MKKYIIATGLLSLSVFVASAEGARPQVQMMMPPVITTGDATKDAQIKALQSEMEAKIKVIRDEYQARIKAIVGDSKSRMASTTPRRGMMMRGSTTPPMMEREDHEGRDGGRDGMMRGSSTEPERMMMQGSTTRPRPNGEMPRRPMVQNNDGNEGNENGGGQAPQVQEVPKGFFSRFFGR